MTEPVVASVAPAPERASFAEDFLDIFYAPSAVFARRRDASPWAALLVVTGLFAIAWYIFISLLKPVFDAQMAQQMAASMANMTPEQQAQVQQMQGRFGPITMMFTGIITVPLTVLVLGLVSWIVGKLLDAQQALRAAFLVVTFSFMPRVVGTIVTAMQSFVVDVTTMTNQFQATLSPARFVDTATMAPALVGILSRFDPFILWSYVIIAIGLHVTGRIPMAKALVGGAILWLLGAVPTIVGAAAALGRS